MGRRRAVVGGPGYCGGRGRGIDQRIRGGEFSEGLWRNLGEGFGGGRRRRRRREGGGGRFEGFKKGGKTKPPLLFLISLRGNKV